MFHRRAYLFSTAKRSRQHTAAAGIHEVASSFVTLPQHSKAQEGEASPVCRTAAIKLIEDDADLSEHELLKIFKVIRKDVTVLILFWLCVRMVHPYSIYSAGFRDGWPSLKTPFGWVG